MSFTPSSFTPRKNHLPNPSWSGHDGQEKKELHRHTCEGITKSSFIYGVCLLSTSHIESNFIFSVEEIKAKVHTDSTHFAFSFISMDQNKSDLFDGLDSK
jgi:hypothetical protein